MVFRRRGAFFVLFFAFVFSVQGSAYAGSTPQPGSFALLDGQAGVTADLQTRHSGNGTVLDISQRDIRSGSVVTNYERHETAFMHLVIVSDDYRWFAHVHPLLNDGHFVIKAPLSPARGYTIYADTVPQGFPKQVFRFHVGTNAAPQTQTNSAGTKAHAGGYDVALSTAELPGAQAVTLTATVSRNGQVVQDLQPYLGSAAHAILIDTHTKSYVHVHPMATGSTAEELPAGSRFPGKLTLQLQALPAGSYRMWLQFQTPSGVVAAPFILTVAPPNYGFIFLHKIWDALFLAAGMFWQVGWSLVLGFLLSGLIQAVVSKDAMREKLGRNGVREIALATFYGAVSSSCSYAAAALSKTLFKKGAGLIPSLAFLFSSTNLVVELGLILLLLMGWQFTAAEWLGGIVLIAIMAVLVKLTYPARLIEEARAHLDLTSGHEHGDNAVEGATLWEKLRNPRTRVLAAQNAAMDWSMLRMDLVIGFLVAGALAALVPEAAWHVLFATGAPAWAQTAIDAVVGPLIAIVTFVCSIGNVPMAAVLWGSGMSFAGVLSFLYADLLVLPLLDVYRKYYGWKMAAYIGGVFFVTMAAAGVIMNAVFGWFHAVPQHPGPSMTMPAAMFSFNYTFWLNLVFGALALYAWNINRRNPMEHGCHSAHEEPAAEPSCCGTCEA